MELKDIIDKNKNIISQYDSVLNNIRNVFEKYDYYLYNVKYIKYYGEDSPKTMKFRPSEMFAEEEDMYCCLQHYEKSTGFRVVLYSNKYNLTYISISQQCRVLDKYGDSVCENKTFESIKDWLQFLNKAKV